eukprot:4067367-Lingulodinium_polyedra.AAC.1
MGPERPGPAQRAGVRGGGQARVGLRGAGEGRCRDQPSKTSMTELRRGGPTARSRTSGARWSLQIA